MKHVLPQFYIAMKYYHSLTLHWNATHSFTLQWNTTTVLHCNETQPHFYIAMKHNYIFTLQWNTTTFLHYNETQLHFYIAMKHNHSFTLQWNTTTVFHCNETQPRNTTTFLHCNETQPTKQYNVMQQLRHFFTLDWTHNLTYASPETKCYYNNPLKQSPI